MYTHICYSSNQNVIIAIRRGYLGKLLNRRRSPFIQHILYPQLFHIVFQMLTTILKVNMVIFVFTKEKDEGLKSQQTHGGGSAGILACICLIPNILLLNVPPCQSLSLPLERDLICQVIVKASFFKFWLNLCPGVTSRQSKLSHLFVSTSVPIHFVRFIMKEAMRWKKCTCLFPRLDQSDTIFWSCHWTCTGARSRELTPLTKMKASSPWYIQAHWSSILECGAQGTVGKTFV